MSLHKVNKSTSVSPFVTVLLTLNSILEARMVSKETSCCVVKGIRHIRSPSTAYLNSALNRTERELPMISRLGVAQMRPSASLQ
ncbi:hypothetical protein TNCV_4788221 [Trichonephila clavipes]|nr:hypothetical protein TNCV_4788221 [Trichonephila clavipes]